MVPGLMCGVAPWTAFPGVSLSAFDQCHTAHSAGADSARHRNRSRVTSMRSRQFAFELSTALAECRQRFFDRAQPSTRAGQVGLQA